jgi:glycosyltransferase involved in cell wall biosynthesis
MVCPELPSADNPGSMAPAARQIESLKPLGIEPVIHDMRGLPKLKYLQAIPKIRKLARNVDLVHAHFGYCGWLAYLAQWPGSLKKPLVMSFMGDDLLGSPYNEAGDLEWFSKQMARTNIKLSKKVTSVITKSREMADLLPVDVTVIPNGVDVKIFQPLEREIACEKLGIESTGIRVLFPGNPDNPRKRFGLAQKAVEVAQSKLGQEISLIPLWNVSPDDVPFIMNSCDAMLMTSLIEGSPNVVKEAMACDLPTIGVPVGDVHEMLLGVKGCYRTSDQAEEIGSRLKDLLDSDRVTNGRDVVFERGLDLASVAQRVCDVYESALAKFRK